MIAESIFYCLRFRQRIREPLATLCMHDGSYDFQEHQKDLKRGGIRGGFSSKNLKNRLKTMVFTVFLCKPHFHMLMISTLLFMTNDKPFVSKMKALFSKMCISPRRNAHFYGSKIAQDRPNMPSRGPKNALKRAKKAFLKPSW